MATTPRDDMTRQWRELCEQQAALSRSWLEGQTQLATGLAGNPVPNQKDALKLWLDTANETLMERHRSAPFLEAQRELLRHGMDFLLAGRELVEGLAAPAGLPMRTEIDEAHRSLQELKHRDVRVQQVAGHRRLARRARQLTGRPEA